MKEDKRHTLQWWMIPKKDKDNQWWWGYQKVYMRKLPEEEKLEYLKKMQAPAPENK